MKAGMTVDQFWRSTLREVDFTIRAYIANLDYQRDISAFNAWYSACFPRMKTMPNLKDFLDQLKPRKPQTSADHYNILMALVRKK